jgi:hypothetical protein
MLGWPRAAPARLGLAALGLLTLGGQHAAGMDQPAMLVYGLVLLALVCAGQGRFGLLGALLALAWIKPQIAILFTLGLGLWAASVPARRRALLTGALTGAALLAAGEWLLPGWIPRWLAMLSNYSGGKAGLTRPETYGPDDWLQLALRAALVVGLALIWWRARRLPAGDWRWQLAAAGTWVVVAAVQQPWFGYNLILLYPPLLWLLAALRHPPPTGAYTPPRLLDRLAIAVFALPWVTAPLLYGVYLARLLPLDTLGWPGFAALYVLNELVLTNAMIVTMLFVYVAWAGVFVTPTGGTRPAHPAY